LPVTAESQVIPQDTVVRQIVMRDARSANKFADQLRIMQGTGVFGGAAAVVAGKPTYGDLAILTSGNYVLVAGDKDRLAKYVPDIDMMAFLFERPRAHLQLNTRVVQLTGPANTDVIQMTETVRALVDAQRTEVVRAFADLQEYLVSRLKRRTGDDLKIYQEIRRLFPTIGDGDRPLSVQEILLLLMVDRALPDLPVTQFTSSGSDADRALLDFQKSLTSALQDPHEGDEQIARDLGSKLAAWENAASAARTWCADSAHSLENRDGESIDDFLSSLKDPRCPLPTWVALRIRRSIGLCQRLYPVLCRKQAHDSLSELQHRFQGALDREHGIQDSITAIQAANREKSSQDKPGRDKSGQEKLAQNKSGQDSSGQDKSGQDKSGQDKQEQVLPGSLRRRLFDLQSVANDLVSVPMALFQAVAAAADDSAPTIAQLDMMFREYADERAKMDQRLGAADLKGLPAVNYSRLEMIESGLNLWLRRGSEAMSRALEQQFYNHYVDQLRLLANRQLGKTSAHDILSASTIENIPDVVQDVLLSDTTVNMFVSNSVSLQFEPDTTGSVSAQVAARLPSQTKLIDRLTQAAQASAALGTLATAAQPTIPGASALTQASQLTNFSNQYGLNGSDILNAIMAGGEAVPVQSGINLSANPSIGFDAGTVTLTLSINETLQPSGGDITDHVTNHKIDDATVTALAYEPTVLSTLTSNSSYYQTTGGFPVLRQIPGLNSLLKDIPAAPFKESKRSKGVYQSSLIILEPVVIPTIEDLVRYYSGLRN
jgi:hypothetical protein